MPEAPEDLDLRVTRLEDEVSALEREVEALREEIRSFARLVERGDITRPEPQ
jgi:chaperonin cofactor prefoldin